MKNREEQYILRHICSNMSSIKFVWLINWYTVGFEEDDVSYSIFRSSEVLGTCLVASYRGDNEDIFRVPWEAVLKEYANGR